VHLLLAVVAAAAQHSRAPSSSSYPAHASSSSNTFTSDNALHTHTHTHIDVKLYKKESGLLLPPQCPSCYTRKSSSSGVYKYTHGMHTRRVCTPQSHLDRDVCVWQSRANPIPTAADFIAV
jgi:hypothetical protein